MTICFLLFLFHSAAFSQSNYTRQFTMKDGLPSNAVRDIFKDSRGLLWIGTDAGLCRFDGRNFTVYTTLDGLAGNKVWSIAEDGSGNLWLACFGGGVSIFDGNHFRNITIQNGLAHNEVRIIKYFPQFDIILAGTRGGLQVFEKDTSYVVDNQKIDPGNKSLTFLYFFLINDLVYMNCNGNKPYLFDPQKKQFVENPGIYFADLIHSNAVFISSKMDTIVNPDRDQIKVIQKDTTRIFTKVGQVFDIVEDGDQNIWIASWVDNVEMKAEGGFYRFNGHDLERFNKRLFIDSRFGYALCYDQKQHLLWLGTLDKGLFLYPESRFTYYDATHFGLNESLMNDLYLDHSSNLWVACDSGVIKKDTHGEVTIFHKKDFLAVLRKYIIRNQDALFGYMNDPEGSNEKYNALMDHEGIVLPNPYLETSGFRYRVIRDSSNYQPDNYSQIRENIKQTGGIPFLNRFTGFRFIRGNSQDEIWVSSVWGSWMMDPVTSTIRRYTHQNLKNFSFDEKDTLFMSDYWSGTLDIIPDIRKSAVVFHMFQSDHEVSLRTLKTFGKGNEIWYGDRMEGLFVSRDGYYKSINKTNLLIPEYIPDICADTAGNLIFCGNSGEIFIGAFRDDSLHILFQISNKNGLIGSAVQWILAGTDNQLYAGTNLGLNVIDLTALYQKGIIESLFFDEDEGYIHPAAHSPVMDENGIIWCANGNELMWIDTRKLKDTTFRPLTVHLTGMEIHHQTADSLYPQKFGVYAVTEAEVPHLKHNWNYLTFTFSCLNYLDPDKDVFRYRLRGLHHDWTDFRNQRAATFTDLQPGRYTLEVEGKNLATSIHHRPLVVSFLILRPWWKQVWFFTVITCIFIAGIWGLILFRTRAVQKKEQLKNEISRQLAELEMKALQSQMNPHFVFNAINSIQSFILDNNVDQALSYLSDFSQIIRLTLENAIRKYIPVAEELGYIGHYLNLEQMRFGDKFEVSVRVSNELDPDTVLIPPMLLQPYIENAIKHGLMHKEGKGHLLIQLWQEGEKQLVCLVEDDGVGRARARELENWGAGNHHKSYGMKLVQDRISLLNRTETEHHFDVDVADLKDEKGNATGTRVVIRLPYLTVYG